MARNITQKQRDEIVRMYVEDELTQREIQKITGYSIATISKWASGLRTRSDAIKLSKKKGKCVLTDVGRAKLSESAKKQCQRSGKAWTKPEQAFKLILNKMGWGVKFPDYLKGIFDLKDDVDAIICFQYPLQRYVCDFVDVNNKIVYLVDGDFWHANPLLYDHKQLTKIQKHNLWHDKNRKRYLESKGFIVCNIWESEIYWNVNIVEKKIRAAWEQVNPLGLHPGIARFDTGVAHLDWSDRLKSLWFKKPKGRPKNIRVKKICSICFEEFEVVNSQAKKRKNCSSTCQYEAQRKVAHPSPVQLKADIESMSWVAIGNKYGVSDNAVRKWARKYKIII
tara:strand:+ start:2968 stop:3978 length:1011 start_codon:yes stop_codon:yes gene_type:complete